MLHGDIGSQGTTPYHPGNASVNANTQWEPLLRVVGPLFCFNVRQFYLVPLTTRYLTYLGLRIDPCAGWLFHLVSHDTS